MHKEFEDLQVPFSVIQQPTNLVNLHLCCCNEKIFRSDINSRKKMTICIISRMNATKNALVGWSCESQSILSMAFLPV